MSEPLDLTRPFVREYRAIEARNQALEEQVRALQTALEQARRAVAVAPDEGRVAELERLREENRRLRAAARPADSEGDLRRRADEAAARAEKLGLDLEEYRLMLAEATANLGKTAEEKKRLRKQLLECQKKLYK